MRTRATAVVVLFAWALAGCYRHVESDRPLTQPQRIDGVVLRNGERVEFESSQRGRVVADSVVVREVGNSATVAAYATSDVEAVLRKEPDQLRTLLAVAGLSVVAIVAFIGLDIMVNGLDFGA